MKPLIAGNWKMHGLAASLAEVDRLGALFGGRAPEDRDIIFCPPATVIAAMAPRAAKYGFAVGGQDCHGEAAGAHTGDVSAEMLKDAGAVFVIVGHSERRAGHGETDAVVNRKAQAALRAGLTPIICVGETESQRDAGKAVDIVGAQLAASLPGTKVAIVIAYEPVWAIGSGLTPSADDIAKMHAFIRGRVAASRILYGGSVKPSNAREILRVPNVDGALVGGASLKASDFHAIISAV